ncbi:MAG: hypothetical protein ACK4PR_08665, partial [Gammaproteobacteria bacterium]
LIAIFRMRISEKNLEKSHPIQAIASNLNRLKKYFNKNKLIKFSSNLRPTLHSIETGYRYLLPEFANKLIPNSGIYQREVEYGASTVIIINGVHYKKLDSTLVEPGAEYAVACMNNLVAQLLSPPTLLLKVKRANEKVIYQASKTVPGISLQYILEQHTEYLAYQSSTNFSAMVILALLLYPKDGKADNYIVKLNPLYNSQNKFEMEIICIDNDQVFGESLLRDGGGICTTFQNVLFFFPQMKAVVDNKFKQSFLNLNPASVCMQWLKMLYQQNKNYSALIENKIFSELEFAGNPNDECDVRLNLPIKLPKGTIEKIYKNFCLIQKILQENEHITHQKLFEEIEPLLARFYHNILMAKKGDILGAMIEVRKPFFSDEIVKTTLTDNEKINIKEQVGKIYSVELISVTEAANNFVANLNFLDFDEHQKSEIFSLIAKELNFLTNLTLRNYFDISAENVLSLLKKISLETITIIGRLNWKFEDIQAICTRYNKLKIVLQQEGDEVSLPLSVLSKILDSNSNSPNYLIFIKINSTLLSLANSPHIIVEKMIEANIEHKELFNFFMSKVPITISNTHYSTWYDNAKAKNYTNILNWLEEKSVTTSPKMWSRAFFPRENVSRTTLAKVGEERAASNFKNDGL